jgi:hypothetical protein
MRQVAAERPRSDAGVWSALNCAGMMSLDLPQEVINTYALSALLRETALMIDTIEFQPYFFGVVPVATKELD